MTGSCEWGEGGRKGKAEGRHRGKWVKHASDRTRGVGPGSVDTEKLRVQFWASRVRSCSGMFRWECLVTTGGQRWIREFRMRARSLDKGIVWVELLVKR